MSLVPINLSSAFHLAYVFSTIAHQADTRICTNCWASDFFFSANSPSQLCPNDSSASFSQTISRPMLHLVLKSIIQIDCIDSLIYSGFVSASLQHVQKKYVGHLFEEHIFFKIFFSFSFIYILLLYYYSYYHYYYCILHLIFLVSLFHESVSERWTRTLGYGRVGNCLLIHSVQQT
jgi:hypothetical protein